MNGDTVSTMNQVRTTKQRRLEWASVMTAGHRRMDGVGMTLSAACGVHCALMPVLLMALPFLGATFIADERIEWVVVGVSAILGFSSLCYGLRRHRQRSPLALLSAGMLLVLGGRLFFVHHPGADVRHAVLQGLVLFTGGMMVAIAHWWNRHLCAQCSHCHDEHQCC